MLEQVKEGEINWFQIPLEDESIRVAKLLNPIYADSLKKNITGKFVNRLKLVANSRLNFIMSSFGTQGSGKSWQILYIVERFCDFSGMEMNIDNVCFTITDLLESVEKGREGDIFVLDEQVSMTGYGSMAERQALKNVEMTVRAHKLNFFFLAPVFIPHNFHYFVEVWERGSLQEWDINKPISEQWKYTKSVLYDHRQHMLGFIITGTPTDRNVLGAYEKKKEQFIKDIKSRMIGKRPDYIINKAYELLEDDEFLEKYVNCNTKNLKRLIILVKLKGGGLIISEVNMLLDSIEYILNFEPKFRDRAIKYIRTDVVKSYRDERKLLDKKSLKQRVKF